MKKNAFIPFKFDINQIRKEFNKKESENEFSSTSSLEELNKTIKDNEEKVFKPNKHTIIIETKINDKNSSNKAEDSPINIIRKQSYDFIDKDNMEKSEHKIPNYYIPFKKIFKEDNKEIDIDELKFAKNKKNNKENEKIINPVEQILIKTEGNKIFPNEKSYYNMNYFNPVFPGVHKNEYDSQNNLSNLQNSANNLKIYIKINEEEQKFRLLVQFGLISLSKKENVNNYLLSKINNSINNNDIKTTNNQFNPINNNINIFYNGNNIDDSFHPNNINRLHYQKNINKVNDSPMRIKISFIKNSSKVNQENHFDSKNKNINLNDIINGKEKRTVVRLRPIPKNYSYFDLLKFMSKHLEKESGKNQIIYKALYFPICKVTGKNFGFCFVMMDEPKYVIDFYNTFNRKIFGKNKYKKRCKVSWANIQGEEFLNAIEDDQVGETIIFEDIVNEDNK